MELNKIYNLNCVEGMKMLPDNSIDLTVTSPPYDTLRNYKGFEWNFEETAKELYRVTKQGGVVIWVVGDATIKGSETGTSFKHALFFMKCGFNLNDTMIWHKTNPTPQFLNSNRYTNSFEYMFCFSKGKPKTFNALCEATKTSGNKTDRSKPSSAVADRGNFKGCWQREEVTITKEQKRKTNVWDIATASKNYGHPAVFPEQLAQDHILSWSNEGDIVLDPFLGSGTTAVVCEKNNRNYIGFEVSSDYVCIAENRVRKSREYECI
jgi:site-specific DNA-methyltransferase (adenine-specific)